MPSKWLSHRLKLVAGPGCSSRSGRRFRLLYAAAAVDRRQYTSGKSATFAGNEHPAENRKYQCTKLPIVLCHGLFGYDRLGWEMWPRLQVRYWGDIWDALNSAGCRVHIARVPAIGNIEERAHHLKRFLNENCRGQDVNLVAHSMGGLDSRFLISHLMNDRGCAFTVRSLTTVSTPHRGSPFMDWIRDNVGVGRLSLETLSSSTSSAAASAEYESNGRLSYLTASGARALRSVLDKLINILDAPAYSNLTTDYLTQHFNPCTPDSANVRYFSYGAVIENCQPTSILWLPHQVVSQQEGVNDGIVSAYSSRWGQYMGTLNADHFEINKKRLAASAKDDAASPKPALAKSILSVTYFNFPLLDFLRLRQLWDIMSITEPLIAKLPLPIAQRLAKKKQVTSALADLAKQQQEQLQSAMSKSPRPEDLYQDRINILLNQMHGPQSIDEFIYGYDNIPDISVVSSTTQNSQQYDSVHFYLSVMDSLAKQGL